MSTDESVLQGRNFVSFGPGIPAQLRADILDCLLYAQLSADQKYNRYRSWKPWIEQYQRIIYQKGGRLTGSVDPGAVTIRRLRDLRYLPASAFGRATSPELHALMAGSLHALFSSEHANTFFNSWFSSGQSESFQVVPCRASRTGALDVLVCGLQMTTRAVKPGPLFWDALSGDMTVRTNGASFSLTEQSYAPHREKISRYLTDVAKKTIAEL
jgi:hypothetical protein